MKREEQLKLDFFKEVDEDGSDNESEDLADPEADVEAQTVPEK